MKYAEPCLDASRTTREGELWVARFSGLLTLRSVAWGRLFVAELLAAQDARAVVVNLEACVPLLSAESWCLLAAGPTAESGVPMAVVARPLYRGALRDYCRTMADRGHVRGPFTEEVVAVEWASRRREHWAHRRPNVAARPVQLNSQSQRPTQSEHAPVI